MCFTCEIHYVIVITCYIVMCFTCDIQCHSYHMLYIVMCFTCDIQCHTYDMNKQCHMFYNDKHMSCIYMLCVSHVINTCNVYHCNMHIHTMGFTCNMLVSYNNAMCFTRNNVMYFKHNKQCHLFHMWYTLSCVLYVVHHVIVITCEITYNNDCSKCTTTKLICHISPITKLRILYESHKDHI